ncbi:hypothetical protein ACHHV8_22395 [Paenibacillus sp. TAB 01]|uniref:hypothetical protein n=1 Tax=Paenibacillus sp. TAB 01 TaxID=3368988 RepID=UPI00375174F1
MNTSAINECTELSDLIKNTLSMEVRVENSAVTNLIGKMEDLGFKTKNSWASVQLPEHTVLEFWKKELVKA